MRFLQVRFPTREAFHRDYLGDLSPGGIFVATGEPFEVGEPILLEITFPEIPEGVLVPGHVAWRRPPTRWRSVLLPGIGIEFAPGETGKREFLVDFATGILAQVRKRQRRLPIRFPVDFGPADSTHRTRASALDLARGGLFLSTDSLVRYGSVLEMELHPPAGQPTLRSRGRVAWLGRLGEQIGMGVQFVLLDRDARDRMEQMVGAIEDMLDRRAVSLTAQSR